MDEFKPCPSCGGTMIRRKAEGGGECEDCETYLIPWNTRPVEDALLAEIARLQAQLAKYTEPLTDEQEYRLTADLGASPFHWRQRDAAIRKVRADG